MSFWGVGSGTGGWPQRLALVRQLLYHLSRTLSPLCFGYFWDRVWHCVQLDWTVSLLFELPWIAGMTGTHHRGQPSTEMEYCELFAPGWPQTAILLTSDSQVELGLQAWVTMPSLIFISYSNLKTKKMGSWLNISPFIPTTHIWLWRLTT
jgi:hypothetical protein